MSRTANAPGFLTNALVITGLCLTSPSNLQAQLMESESLQFVPADTNAAMSVNMRAILKKVEVDFDEPLISQLRQLPNVDSTFLDHPKLEQIIVVFPSAGKLMKFGAPISPNAFFERMHLSKYFESTQDNYKGQQIHVRRWSRGIHKGREPRVVWFFPANNVVASGTRNVAEQMIDAESSKSHGKELVNHLNSKAEMHFILEGNDKISARMLASMLGHLHHLPARPLGEALQGARRVEVLLSYAEKLPLQVTIEMKDGASMDRLMEQIKSALAQAPGILDALEEHEIPREEEVQPPFRKLIALGRTAVKEVELERDGTTLRMTLGHVKGLEKLPQLYIKCSLILAAMSGP